MRASGVRGLPLPPCADRACLHATGRGVFARAGYLLAALNFGGGSRVRRNGRRREEQIEQPIFGGLLGALGDFVEFFLAHHVDGGCLLYTSDAADDLLCV